MAQTLSTYTTLVQNEVDDTSTAASAVIQQLIKETYQEIMRQTGKYFQTTTTETQTMTSGLATYSTAEEAIKIVQVAFKTDGDTNYDILQEMSQEDALNVYINIADSTPVAYYMNGDTITLAPTPNENGTLRVVYQPLIDELATTSVIPDRYTRTVVLGAIYRFKLWEDNYAAGTTYKGLYDQSLRDMILELATQTKPLQPKLY